LLAVEQLKVSFLKDKVAGLCEASVGALPASAAEVAVLAEEKNGDEAASRTCCLRAVYGGSGG